MSPLSTADITAATMSGPHLSEPSSQGPPTQRVQRIKRATARRVPGLECSGTAPVPSVLPAREPHTIAPASLCQAPSASPMHGRQSKPVVTDGAEAPRRVGWQRHRAVGGSSPKGCVSSFYLGPGRAQARGAGTSMGAQDRFMSPWDPPVHPHKRARTLTEGSCSPTLGSPPKTAGAGGSGGHLALSWLPPCSAASLSFAGSRSPPPLSPGCAVPEVRLDNPLLRLSSVICPNQS